MLKGNTHSDVPLDPMSSLAAKVTKGHKRLQRRFKGEIRVRDILPDAQAYKQTLGLMAGARSKDLKSRFEQRPTNLSAAR